MLTSTITIANTEIPTSGIISIFLLYCGNKHGKRKKNHVSAYNFTLEEKKIISWMEDAWIFKANNSPYMKLYSKINFVKMTTRVPETFVGLDSALILKLFTGYSMLLQ